MTKLRNLFVLLCCMALVYGGLISMMSLMPEVYDVKKSYAAPTETLEVFDSKGNVVDMTEDDLKAKGMKYHITWVSPDYR